MSLYRYETHLHTMESSACSVCSAKEHVRYYKSAGYTGIIVTDHFLNGNTCVPRNLPWEEQMDLFCRGYELAKEEGDKIGLSVFFGWEAGFQGTDFLIYGLDKEWLKKHPDLLSWTIEEQYQRVHADGGFVVHAHPFRMRPYIKKIRLFPKSVDAVEVFNVGNRNTAFDQQALSYAKNHNLLESAGTDAHGIENCHTGLAFHHKLNSIQDFIAEIQAGEYELIKAR